MSSRLPAPQIVFNSAYDQGFARAAAVTFPLALVDPAANARAIIAQAHALAAEHVCLAVFPELCLSGYCADELFLSDLLHNQVLEAIEALRAASVDLLPALVVGAPLRVGGRLYNCALVIQGGTIHGVVPKSYLPTYGEFYEKRYFASGVDAPVDYLNWFYPTGAKTGAPSPGATAIPAADTTAAAAVANKNSAAAGALATRIPFGANLLFSVADIPGLTFHVEICEDLWVPVPPSARAALAGANVLVNLSSSPITVGRAEDRQLLARASSARGIAAYVYAAAGQGESSTDLAWDGQTFIYEAGQLLGESERFPQGVHYTIADLDVEGLNTRRVRQGSFDDNRAALVANDAFRRVEISRAHLRAPRTDIGLRRRVDRFPFVPTDPARLNQDCYEAYNIQVAGLVQRLHAIGNPKIVLGVSGGLDSTHALIVAAKAVDQLGVARTQIQAITMPGFATSAKTRDTALALATSLGCQVEELDIRPTATQMLTTMGHPYGKGERGREVYDVTFENVQAGLRTDFLFRIANQRGGIVLGTGDLSELALGWCTFGVGDQMSHYNVNAAIPKTLIQHLIRWVANTEIFSAETSRILLDVLATEISPELIPARAGQPMQSTQAKIGPYALHDFTLWHVLQGARPSRIAFLAQKAWADPRVGRWPAGLPQSDQVAYDLPTIYRWETEFFRRFFANQFKRSTLPNGPKVVAGGSLSPRGDWRMPADASARAWLAELERNVPHS